MSKVVEAINRTQFAIVRILTSCYLAYFFISLLEQKELVEKLTDVQTNAHHILLIIIPVIALLLCALLFLNSLIPIASLGLLICYQLGFIFLPIPREVQASYISIILLIFSLFFKKNKKSSFLSTQLSEINSWRVALFLAVYFGFTISGLSKLFYKPWLNGEVINFFCTTSQIGNLVGTHLCEILPKTLSGYFVLFVEIVSFPLAIFKKTRPLSWFLNTLLHIFIPIFLYVWPVSYGVWLIQIILFDGRWLQNVNQLFLKRDMRFGHQNQNY